jgi:hypothetical protein
MKSQSEHDALAIRQAARNLLLEKNGDKLTPKKNISVAELRAAALALATAQKMESQSAKDSDESLLNDVKEWFLADRTRTIQATADKFGLRYTKVRQHAHGGGWFEIRERMNEDETNNRPQAAGDQA